MKESRFNTIIDFEGHPDLNIAYNSRTTALTLIEKEKTKEIARIIAGDTSGVDSGFISDLIKGGFIMADDFDEIKFLKYVRNSRFSNQGALLTIATTLECNFRCPYCFEGSSHEGSMMSVDIQDKIMEYVKKQNRTHVSICWYGGEPLLALEVIEGLAPRFIGYCKEKGIPYYSNMLTNGYLLTEDVCKKLKSYEVSSIQITLDGSEEYHNKKRIDNEKAPSYKRILENIFIASDYFDISVRINIDHTNYHSASTVLNDLHKYDLLKKVNPYLGLVCNVNDEYESDICLTQAQYADINRDFQKLLYSMTNDSTHTPKGRALFPLVKRCGLEIPNSLVVSPNGDLFKCLNHIGRSEYCVGNIITGLTMNNTLFDYINPDDHFDSPPCKSCKILPLCYGGCIDRAQKKGSGYCIPVKYRLNQYLHDLAEQIYEESTVKV